MITPEKRTRIQFGGLARYRILVEGELDSEWCHRLGDLTIDTTIVGDGVPQTTVSGRFADQAALHGLIDTLYGLHLPIVRIEQIEDVAETGIEVTNYRPD